MMQEAVRYGFEYSKGYDEVHSFMQRLFPRYPIAADDKKNFEHQRKVERIEAIEGFRWLTYNHAWLNVLIFDIDYPIGLKEAYDLAIDKIGLEPTWISETDKGVHIAYALSKAIKYDWKKPVNLAKHIKVSISKELSADENGSHRLRGFWRNTLMHNYYASLKTYTLEDFYHISNKYQKRFKKINIQQQFNNDLVKRQIKYNNIYFKQGNRNNSLWYTAMQQTNSSMTEDEIKDIVFSLHHNYTQHRTDIALDYREVSTIARSVVKYNQENANYVSSGSYQDREKWNIGAMKLEPMRGLSKAEYERETAKRKALAAQYTADKKATRTRKAITDAIHRLKFLLLPTTVRNIAAYAKRSIGTISRYLKEEEILSLLVCSISSKHVLSDKKTSLVSGSLSVGEYFSLKSLLFEVVCNNMKEIVLDRIQIE